MTTCTWEKQGRAIFFVLAIHRDLKSNFYEASAFCNTAIFVVNYNNPSFVEILVMNRYLFVVNSFLPIFRSFWRFWATCYVQSQNWIFFDQIETQHKVKMDFWQLLGLAEGKQKEKPSGSGNFLSTKVMIKTVV